LQADRASWFNKPVPFIQLPLYRSLSLFAFTSFFPLSLLCCAPFPPLSGGQLHPVPGLCAGPSPAVNPLDLHTDYFFFLEQTIFFSCVSAFTGVGSFNSQRTKILHAHQKVATVPALLFPSDPLPSSLPFDPPLIVLG